MSLPKLLSALRTRRITLTVDGDRLRCDAPKGSLTKELQQQLSSRKLEVIRFLVEAAHSAQPIPRVDRHEPLPLSFGQERMCSCTGSSQFVTLQHYSLRAGCCDISPSILRGSRNHVAQYLRTTFENAKVRPLRCRGLQCDRLRSESHAIAGRKSREPCRLDS